MPDALLNYRGWQPRSACTRSAASATRSGRADVDGSYWDGTAGRLQPAAVFNATSLASHSTTDGGACSDGASGREELPASPWLRRSTVHPL